MSERCKHGKLPENPCWECDEERGEAHSSFAAPAGSAWVALVDQTPPEGERVLMRTKNNGDAHGVRLGNCLHIEMPSGWGPEVTHWMPNKD